MNKEGKPVYSLSKFKLMVALLSPNSFFAVTLYLPASSTVTLFISSDAKYDWPSCLSIVCCVKRNSYKNVSESKITNLLIVSSLPALLNGVLKIPCDVLIP